MHAGDGTRARELLLYVPAATTSLKFGVTLASTGRLHAEHLTLAPTSAEASTVSAYDMMAHALPLIRAKALNSGNVDWPAEEGALSDDDLKNFPAQEAYSRLREVLDALADRHSILQTPKDALASRESAFATRAIESRLMADIGYVLVPGLRGTNSRAGAAFTAELCSRIAALAPTSSKGWILDLRDNTGGNMWPMLNGCIPC